MTGKQLAAKVRAVAAEHGWRYVHFNAAGVRRGVYVTPYTGDRGFPDLVLARRGSVLVVELKGAGDQLRPGQLEWLVDAGAGVGGSVTAGVVGKTELETLLAHLGGTASRAELLHALGARLERARRK